MYIKQFPCDIGGVNFDAADREQLEHSIIGFRSIPARTSVFRPGEPLHHASFLLAGIVAHHIDDRHGLRQILAVHFPREFIDLHGYPVQTLDHDITTITAATVALIPHSALDNIAATMPLLARKLWSATMVDGAIQRAWSFRLGRLDAAGRVAHFLCETNARLIALGLSDGGRFALEINQSDLAEICGLTNIHVNRIMRQLREEQLCVFRSCVVDILDLPKLAARGQFHGNYLNLNRPEIRPALTPAAKDIRFSGQMPNQLPQPVAMTQTK